jgi:hypothetical protein
MNEGLKRVLREGNDGSFKSDFAVDWDIILCAVNAGYDEDAVVTFLRQSGPNYNYIAQGLGGNGRAERYACRLYSKAVE